MKRFFFREMLLASFKDRKARRIQFDPGVTIIRGENETGKSSLLKSLFRTFGAEPAKVHPNWIDADVRSVVRFDLDGVQHGILRHNNNFTVFNAKDAPIGRFRSVTNDLGPYFARLFSFGLRLPNQQGVFTALPPAFYFLPYYMDQDGSWTASWAAFAKLKQFSNWKKVHVTNSEAKLKQLDSRERRREVNAYYEERMQRYLQRLDVHSVSDAAVKKLDAPLKDTGSELPRALLAYQIAFLHVIEKFGTSARAPLVIDSPNQQDQDPKHIVKMLEFIRDERPPQTQMILGLVDTSGISFGGTEIMLDRKHSLLSEKDFDQVGPEVQGFIDRSLESPT